MTNWNGPRLAAASGFIGCLLASGAALADTDGLAPIWGAFGETKYIFDSRLRSENVEQDGIAETAHAITLRARLGFETGKAWNTSLLIEGDAVIPIQDDYRPDPTSPDHATYPVVADPEAYEFNRI